MMRGLHPPTPAWWRVRANAEAALHHAGNVVCNAGRSGNYRAAARQRAPVLDAKAKRKAI